MKIIVELPDNFITGFVNFVHGDMLGLSIGTISIDSERKQAGFVSYKSCACQEEEE